MLAHTNGISLLSAHGFGPDLERQAGKVARWLDGYLAAPAGGGQVLVP